MGATYIMVACPWPCNSDGTPPADDGPLDAAVAARIAQFTDRDRITDWLDVRYGDTVKSFAEERLSDETCLEPGLDEDEAVRLFRADVSLSDDQLWAYVAAQVHEELAGLWSALVGGDYELRHDGVRLWAESGGMSHGDYPSETSEALAYLEASGMFNAPMDGEEFIDMAAVAAALAVTEHVIARTEAALLRTGPTAEALAAARAEWAQLRNDLVPTGRLIRATMLQVAH